LPKKTFEVAAAATVELIVQVKDNQPTLHQQIQQICATTAPSGRDCSRTKGRSRDERRTVTVFDATAKLANTEWQPHVATIIQVERNVLVRNSKTGQWKRSVETSFYISNVSLDAARAAKAIRAHWGIENTSHHSRDVTLGEDASRIRTNPGVFARLRSFAYNILKANRSNSLPQDRYRAALGGIKRILKMLGIQQR